MPATSIPSSDIPQPRSIGPAGGLNAYGYGFGDPVNLSDRGGLGPEDESFQPYQDSDLLDINFIQSELILERDRIRIRNIGPNSVGNGNFLDAFDLLFRLFRTIRNDNQQLPPSVNPPGGITLAPPLPINLPPAVIIGPPIGPGPGPGPQPGPASGSDDAGAGHPLTRNAGFLLDFLLGTGRTYRDYLPNDPQTIDMMGSPGANYMRDQFQIGGCQTIQRIGYGTFRAAHDTILNRSTADLFSTAFQVGGFRGASVTRNPDDTATFVIRNEAGRNSFWFHVATNLQASPSGAPTPMRTIYQTFRWTEPTSVSGCR